MTESFHHPNHPNEISLPATSTTFAVVAPPSDSSASASSMFATAHRILRGRYRWAVGLGVGLAVLGAYLGGTLPRATYLSRGIIEVAPRAQRVLYDSEEKGMIPMFDSYIYSQSVIAGSRRVVDIAMQSEAWRKLSDDRSEDAIARFQSRLSVWHGPRTQTIDVSFTDEDPDIAVTAVNAVLKAYMQVVAENEAKTSLDRVHALDRRRMLAIQRLTDLRGEVLQATGGFGIESMNASYESLVAETTKLDDEVRGLEAQIAATKAASAAPEQRQSMTETEIAVLDPALRALLEKRQEVEETKKRLQDENGYGPKNPMIVQLVRDLEKLNQRIAEQVQDFRVSRGKTPDARLVEIAQKERERDRVLRQRDSNQDELRRLSTKRAVVANLDDERATVEEQLNGLKRELEKIDVESSLRGRISVLAEGDRPVSPETDRRRSLAALGAVSGVGLGFGLVLLWGMREGRVRHVVDVDAESARGLFLGVVPDVRDPSADRETGGPLMAPEMTDYCVHHIRAMLQLRFTGRSGVVGVTSPGPGSGKTTLGIALAKSYAATGSRTLLIDCDFVGHGLTTAFRSIVCDAASAALSTPADGGPAPGSGTRSGLLASIVDARRMAFSDHAVDELRAAARAKAGVGDPAMDSVVRALEGLHSAAGAQGADDRGILRALDGRPLSECVVDTGVANLTLLPVGAAREEDARALSRTAVERLVAAACAEYDTVLVDTGPVLGSIEAAFVCAATKEVLVVVARGERRPLVDDAIARVSRVGANVAGVVFNKASGSDVARSAYASRSKSRPAGAA
jgi:succinoglycan biosynthesis transport protein ExoP